MDTTTLITKVLLPRRREDVLTRQRLLNRLYDMVDYRLVLVSAPAGYGKSTLLVDFAEDLEHPVCWYALDVSDHDPRLFLERLVMSIRRRFPDFGDSTLRALAASSDLRGGAPGVVRVLVNEIVTEIPRWFVLVLDDYHTLGRSPDVDAILSNFIAYQRDQCLTIIASRVVPSLPLIIPLVAKGGVGGLGQGDLQFLPEEVQALFAHNYGTELSEEEAQALAEQSEGWITGLLLTAYTRWHGVLQSWMRARNSHQPIYDYLAQEVFDHQPPAMQDFLTLSSTLTEMNQRLCRDLLGLDDAEEMLDALETENLFVMRLEHDWYRYHHLFREFLQTRLRRQDEERWRALHLQAAAWFEAQGQLRQAVDHYLAVGALSDAARLMGTVARDLYVAGQLTTLMTWREQLTEEILVEVPRLALFQSRAAYKLGEHETALALTEIAERGYEASEDAEGLAWALLQRCEIWLTLGQARRALDLGYATLDRIEQTGVPVGYEAHRILGLAHVDQGEFEQGHDHLTEALRLGDSEGQDYDRALIRTGLAYCLGLQGRLEKAVALHREAVAIWRQVGSDAGLADELNDLGFHLYALGEYDEAMRCLREALTLAHQTGLRQAEAFSLVNLGEMTRDLGLLSQAIDYCERGHAVAKSIGFSFLTTYSQEALGLVYRAAHRHDEAIETIASALGAAVERGSDHQVGRYRASLGVVRAEAGQSEAGLEDLIAAEDMLSQLGAPVELQRASLMRAWAQFLAGDKDAAMALLGGLLDSVSTSGETLVFISEGQHAAPMLRAARKAFRGDATKEARLKRVLKQIGELASTAARLFPHEAPAPQESGPPLKVFGFGPGRVELGGETIPTTAWGASTARQLFFYMLIHGARSREQIFADFWPELTAQKAKASFHTTKFRLNRALGRDAIDYDGRLYMLHPDLKAWFDVAAFRELLESWRQSQDVDMLAEAVELYTGDFLTECYMDWCEMEREVLRVRCLEALETLAERLLSRRQYRRAIRALRQALSIDPARETFHQQLMRAYALAGQRSRALAQYERCVVSLREELGAGPSHLTTDLYDRIKVEAPLD